MKIIKENKENLPISFLTDFISKGWEEVGYLKADIEAIREIYKGTKNIEELIQNLIDAYLVCIGQLEAHISDKNYIEYPEESGLNGTKLKEDFELKVSDEGELVEIKADNLADYDVKKEENKIVLSAEDKDDSEDEEEIEEKSEEIKEKTPAKDFEAFEYFTDFDEPDLSAPRLTDKDLYDEE